MVGAQARGEVGGKKKKQGKGRIRDAGVGGWWARGPGERSGGRRRGRGKRRKKEMGAREEERKREG